MQSSEPANLEMWIQISQSRDLRLINHQKSPFHQRLLLGINWEMQQPLGNSSKFGYVTNNPNRVETDKKVREFV